METKEKKKASWRNNKWFRAAIPALLLHCSIGTVYCWSIFSQEIADYIGFSKSATEWAFSFAIFFLGMSAAFLGNVVEKDIHKASLIAAICFAVGMAGTGFFIWYGGAHKGSALALIGIYICYGFIMGIGLGTGYLSPVKTLMLWFEDRKGLATGLAVAGFGSAKAIASPIMQAMLDNLGKGGIYKMFIILAGVYFVMMFTGHLLLSFFHLRGQLLDGGQLGKRLLALVHHGHLLPDGLLRPIQLRDDIGTLRTTHSLFSMFFFDHDTKICERLGWGWPPCGVQPDGEHPCSHRKHRPRGGARTRIARSLYIFADRSLFCRRPYTFFARPAAPAAGQPSPERFSAG